MKSIRVDRFTCASAAPSVNPFVVTCPIKLKLLPGQVEELDLGISIDLPDEYNIVVAQQLHKSVGVISVSERLGRVTVFLVGLGSEIDIEMGDPIASLRVVCNTIERMRFIVFDGGKRVMCGQPEEVNSGEEDGDKK